MPNTQYNDFPAITRDYLFYLGTIKGRSKKTIEAYSIDLKLFLSFMKCFKNSIPYDNLSNIIISDISIDFIKNISLSDVYEFLHFTLNDRDNNARTRSRKVSSIKGWFKYLTVNAALLTENPVKNLEVPSTKKSLPKYLTLEQSLGMLSNVNTKYPLRDFCMLTLFLNCGMRVSELVGINLTDINLKEKTLRLLGKGNKERDIYINESCVEAVKQYIENERCHLSKIVDKNALFLSSTSGKRIGVRQVQNIVKEILADNNLDGMGYSPHKLRHTAATLMYRHGNVDIRVLKEILGHAGIGTTEIYTHVSDENMEKAINNNPLSKVKKK